MYVSFYVYIFDCNFSSKQIFVESDRPGIS